MPLALITIIHSLRTRSLDSGDGDLPGGEGPCEEYKEYILKSVALMQSQMNSAVQAECG